MIHLGKDVKLNICPILVTLHHDYIFEGPCRMGKGFELTKEFDDMANAQLIKEIQSSYQQLTADLKANLDTQQEYNEEQKQYIAELKDDRHHLREERDSQRRQIEQLTRTMNEWKSDSDKKIRSLQAQVARNGRQIECMKPLLCGREGCAIRVPVTITTNGTTEINPIDKSDL